MIIPLLVIIIKYTYVLIIQGGKKGEEEKVPSVLVVENYKISVIKCNLK